MAEDKERETTVEIELASSRYKHLLSAILCLGVGVVVALHMGTIGWIIGGTVAAFGVSSAWQFLQTILHPPGIIALREKNMLLPVGLSTGKEASLPTGELRHAYVIRHALPWHHASPILVIE